VFTGLLSKKFKTKPAACAATATATENATLSFLTLPPSQIGFCTILIKKAM